MESIFPDIKAVDPRAYLADRVKRGVAFVAVLRAVGNETEPCLSTHIQRPAVEPDLRAQANEVVNFYPERKPDADL